MRLVAALVLGPIEALLALVVIVAWLTVGLRRWVRVLAFVLLVLGLVQVGLASGLGTLLTYVGAFAAFNLIASLYRLGRYRISRYTAYEPASGGGWPVHAERELMASTAELERLGFERLPDAVSSYALGEDVHRTRVRFFRHASEPVFATFSATDRAAKTVARSLTTRLTSGGWLTTCDHLTDSALVPATAHHSALHRGTWTQMLADHRAGLAKLGGGELVTDPMAAARAARDAWIEQLLADNRARAHGDVVGLTPRAILGSQARTWASWLR